ncbi:MAG: hypothetical protein GX484_05230 [Chloroflexi bacterium]|nr:hypothetical protein [Chloroflexota bacterium]
MSEKQKGAGMSTVKVTIPLRQTGVVAVRLQDECKELIETRVQELFRAMFPPGSDGPPEGFSIGALYEQAACEVAQKIEAEIQAAIQRDMDQEVGEE